MDRRRDMWQAADVALLSGTSARVEPMAARTHAGGSRPSSQGPLFPTRRRVARPLGSACFPAQQPQSLPTQPAALEGTNRVRDAGRRIASPASGAMVAAVLVDPPPHG
jgi:hypothetical protein